MLKQSGTNRNKVKRAVAFLCAAIMLFSLFPMSVFAENTGYSASAAIECELDQGYYKGWTKETDHYDCYNKITLPANGILTINITKPIDDEGEQCDCTVSVIDAKGTVIWKHNGYGDNEIIDYQEYSIGLAAGTYYVNFKANFYVTSGLMSATYRFTFEETEDCELEPNDTRKTANPLELDREYRGWFGNSEKEEDWFKFDLKANSIYRIYMGNHEEMEGTNWIGHLVAPTGDEKTVSSSYGVSYDDEAECSFLEYCPSSTGTYYLHYYNYVRTPLEYTIKIVPVYEDDAESGGKTGFSTAEAIECAAGTAYTKVWMSNNGDKDCYNKIELPQNGILTINFEKTEDTTNDNRSYSFGVFDANGTEIGKMSLSKDDQSGSCSYKIGLAAGTYYVNLKVGSDIRNGFVKCSYSFEFEATDLCELEPDNSITAAMPIQPDNRYQAWIGGDYTDWYVLQLEKGESYRIYLEKYDDAKYYDVDFVTSDGTETRIFKDEFKFDEKLQCSYYEYTPEKTDKYYIKLYCFRLDPIEYAIQLIKLAYPVTHAHVLDNLVVETQGNDTVVSGTCALCGEQVSSKVDGVYCAGKGFGFSNYKSVDYTAETEDGCEVICETELNRGSYWHNFIINEVGLHKITTNPYNKYTIYIRDHEWGDWTELDENEHKRVCANDASHVETAAHEWDEGKVVKEPAPGVEGEKQFTCTVCGAVKSEPIEALPETEAPTTEAPTTEAPTTEEPSTEAPASTEPTTADSAQSFTLGDVNMDGKINSSDARIALRAAAKTETLSDLQLLLADVNEDGKIKSGDARTILRIAAKLDPMPEKKVSRTA